jgi:eukaryotic-like serine/threonine-protein kinase
VTPDRWQEIKQVLAGALERTPPERRSYLDQACPDASLRREVESLISAHEQGDGSFMERPAMGTNDALKAGTKLGPYEILARLGARIRAKTLPQGSARPGEAQSSQHCGGVRRG